MKILLVYWIVFVPAISVMVFLVGHGPDMIALYGRAVPTTGDIIALDPKNHDTALIAYRVRATEYRLRVPRLLGYHVGGNAQIFYDRDEPWRATAKNPPDGPLAILGGSLGSGLIVGTVFAIVLRVGLFSSRRPMR